MLVALAQALNITTIFRAFAAPERRLRLLNWLVLAAMLLASVAAYQSVRRIDRAVELPVGCDDFGYLRQARLVRDVGPLRALDTAINDDLTVAMIRAFKSSGLPVNVWQEAAAPHCHHYKPHVDRIVLQYPPGTGFVLSLFPEGQQSRTAARLVVLAILAGMLAAMVRIYAAAVALLALYLSAACFSVLGWFGSSMSIPSSIALAFALAYLLAAKLDFSDLTKGWRWHAAAGLLLGIATTIRIPNLFLIAGFAACYGVAWLRRPSLLGLLGPAAFGAALVAGLLPVLAANAINAGSPWATTYSAVDAARPMLDWTVFREGVSAFFVEHPHTARTMALSIAPPIVLAVALLRRFEWRAAMVLLAAAVNLVTNLGYFILHDPRAPYYPVPMAMFVAASSCFALIGMARHSFDGSEGLRFRRIAAALCLAAVVAAVALRPVPVSALFKDASLHRTFDGKTVVWADLKSGYFHFFQGRQASKLATATADGQDRIMAVVAELGLSQIAISDSRPMAVLIERLRGEGRAAPAGRLYDNDMFVVCPVRLVGGRCPAIRDR